MLLIALATSAPGFADQPNILLIVVDDVGIEWLSFYDLGDHGLYPDTPQLTEWAANWRLFRDAWSTPLCSPNRATIQTGRYGFRTGIGTLVECDGIAGLDTTDTELLAKVLGNSNRFESQNVAYETAAFGKWHLGTEDSTPESQPCDGVDRPIDAGYDHFDGKLLDVQDEFEFPRWSYSNYVRTTLDAGQNCAADDPHTEVTGGYLTADLTDWVIGWIQGQATARWFAHVAYQAAHLDYHCAPVNDERYEDVEFEDCNEEQSDDRTKMRTMIQALDADLGRLVGSVNLASTLVIIMGDNGSPYQVVGDPLLPNRAKGTVFQGGVRVPLLIGGWGIDNEVFGEGHIVGSVDLYITTLSAAGVETLPPSCQPTYTAGCRDGIDLTPYLGQSPPQTPLRSCLYTEFFYPNFVVGSGAGPSMAQQAIRDNRYKYLRTSGNQAGFYDLQVDPWEEEPLNTAELTQDQLESYDALTEELDELIDGEGGDQLVLCTGLAQVGEPCDSGEDCCSKVCGGSTSNPECVNPVFPPVDPDCPGT